MSAQYRCKNERRQVELREKRDNAGNPISNGIDYLEVSADQRTLLVHFVHDLPTNPQSALTRRNLGIEGGVRVRNVRVTSANASGKVLTARVNTPGDFSTYRLRLVTSPTDARPPTGFDSQLSEVAFSFKIDCPTEFDCEPVEVCPEPVRAAPLIDYMAKDYASFRRLVLDRLAVIMPDWQERNPADLGIVLAETLAYAADRLSYYQDAVASEAYLGTARKRVSMRRHARLLDYPMHDGCNARAWVQVHVESSPGGVLLKKEDAATGRRTRFLTRCLEVPVVREAGFEEIVKRQRPEVFEPLHDLVLYQAHNEIPFYTWGDEECCLPAGATRATLRRRSGEGLIEHLAPGHVLIFEEGRGPTTGQAADAKLGHRHAVRLTEVRFTEDPLFQEEGGNPSQAVRLVEIGWAPEDALPFPLCLSTVIDGTLVADISVARGNVILVDHGRTISPPEVLPPILDDGLYRPALRFGPVTRQGTVYDQKDDLVQFDPQAPASAALRWEMREVRPAVELLEAGENQPWLPQRDLLGSDRFATEFVVETEDDGRAFLRFGTPPLGRAPVGALQATYRVGNGRSGNVGAGAIAHAVTDADGIRAVRNALPARGGVDPEPLEQVRLYAPQAFRIQERAVTEADYATVAERHAEVQKAAATRRWTGSWYTMFVTIDRARGLPVDPAFKDELRRHLERFRLAGYDLEIEAPGFVPLDIALTICAASGYLRSNVKQALLETFGNDDRPGRARGFFHPDNFTFGEPVYLSKVVTAAMQVPGVTWVDAERFQRWGQLPRDERAEGRIAFGRLEIARLDNDPSAPENGKIEFIMQGGL